jgi:hypothetical protein
MEAISRAPILFDDLATLIMEAQAMRVTHIKDMLNDMRRDGLVAFELPERAKKPQPNTAIRSAER